jgi:tetratricopeptide (TPR) repeat protein
VIAIRTGVTSDMATTFGAIGFVYLQEGNYAEATEYYSKALKLAEEGKDAFSTAEIYLNLGEIDWKLGNYKDAITYNKAAINIYKEIGMRQQLALAYIQLGNVCMSLKKYSDAAENFSKGIQEAKEVSNLEYLKIGYESLSALDSSQGNFKQSLEHYKLSIRFRDSLLNEGNTKKLVQQQMQYDYDKKDMAAKSEQVKKDVLKEKELQKQKLMRNGFIGGFMTMVVFAAYFLISATRSVSQKSEVMNCC